MINGESRIKRENCGDGASLMPLSERCIPVGASLLAMDVNDNACCLNKRVALETIASRSDRRTVAPT